MTPDVQPSIAKSRPTRRRWFRFSLRSFLIFTTLACPLGWMAKERHQSEFERKLGEKLEENHSEITYLGPYDSLELHDKREPQSWWHDLARQILGVRIFRIYNLYGGQENFTPLAGLSNLTSLKLHGGAVYDLTPIAGLKKLEELSLMDTVVSDLTPLARLKSLKKLRLVDMPVSDLTGLAGLENLKSLRIYRTPVPDLTPLAGLKNLEELRLVKTPDTDLAPLIGLTNLKSLQVPASSVSDLTPLVGLKHLELLYLPGSSFVNDLLERLWLSRRSFTDRSRPSISDEQFEFLQQALPNCNVKR